MPSEETPAAKALRWMVLLSTSYCVLVLAVSAWHKLNIETSVSYPINTGLTSAYAMFGLAAVGVVAILFNLRRSTRIIFACYAIVFGTLVGTVFSLLIRLQHGASSDSLLVLLGTLLAFGACVLHHKDQHYL